MHTELFLVLIYTVEIHKYMSVHTFFFTAYQGRGTLTISASLGERLTYRAKLAFTSHNFIGTN